MSLFPSFLTSNTSFCIIGALVGFMMFMESFIIKTLQKDLNTITSLPSACRSINNFCDAFVLLCLAPMLFIVYHIFISKYFAILCWVGFAYHSYVRKLIRHGIFWHYGGSFDSSLGHFTYFFKGAWPTFSGSNCCPCLLGMLGSHHSYICHSFPTTWIFYSSWCCGTCWNRHFSLPIGIIQYLSFVTPHCPL